MSNGPPFYDDDAVLLSWGESPKDGAWIKLQIKEDLIPDLRGQPRGAEHGARFTIVITGPLANDENSVPRKGKAGDAQAVRSGAGTKADYSTVNQPPPSPATNSVTSGGGETGGGPSPLSLTPPVPKPKRRWSEMPPSQRAALLTKDPEFQAFACECFDPDAELRFDESTADAWLKAELKIESKADIWGNSFAVAKLEQIESQYRAWSQARGHGVI